MKEGWEYKKLGEVCTVLNGFAFKSGKYTDSGIRVMRITNVQKGFIVDDDPKYYPSKEMQGLNQYILKENDLLMSLTGNVGRVGLLQKELLPAALNQRVACLRIKDYSLSLRFLFHWLNSAVFEQDAFFSASGIAQKNLSTEWLKSYKIAIPPLSEQQHIVEELDLLSSIIEKKKAQLKELDHLAQSLFYEMFGDPITNEKGWEVKKLGEICSFSQGIQVDVTKQSTEKITGWNRFLRIVDYTTENDDIRYVNVNDPKYILNKEDIAMVRYGASVGTSDIGKEGVLANNLFKINYSKYVFNKYYLLYSFHTMYFKAFIHTVSFGAAMPALSFKVMKDFQLLQPPLSCQQSFASKIEAIEHQKELIKKSIKDVETLFNSRMDYYFN